MCPRLKLPYVSVLISKARSFVKGREPLLFVGANSIVAFFVAWMGMSPSFSMGMNWDAAGLAGDAVAGGSWAVLPWNSHFGVYHLYFVASRFAVLLGMPALDGVRALNAFAVAGSAAAVSFATLTLTSRWLWASLATGLFLSSWGTIVLVFTWEDNLLFHPFGLAALAYALVRIDHWRYQDSVVTGVLVALASLMSWQGASYLFPPLYAALFLGGQQRWPIQLRDVIFVPVAFLFGRLSWVCLLWITAPSLHFSKLITAAFERPAPNFLPENLAGWIRLFGKRAILEHAGVGLAQVLGPPVGTSPRLSLHWPLLGLLLIIAALAAFVVTAFHARRSQGRPLHLVAASFAGLTAGALVYLDLLGDKYKRYDYLPPLVAILATAGLWRLLNRTSSIWLVRVGAAAVGSVVVVQTVFAYQWNRDWYARLPASEPKNFAGHESETWTAYFRRLRRENPAACAFVFSFEDVLHARYQLEIRAAMYSELINPAVVGAPATVKQWPRLIPDRPTHEVRASLRGCEWLSAGAQTLLLK